MMELDERSVWLLQKTGKAVLALKRMTHLSNRSDGSDSPPSQVNGNALDGNSTCFCNKPWCHTGTSRLFVFVFFRLQTRIWGRRPKRLFWLWSSSWGASRISHKPFTTLRSPVVLLYAWPASSKVTRQGFTTWKSYRPRVSKSKLQLKNTKSNLWVKEHFAVKLFILLWLDRTSLRTIFSVAKVPPFIGFSFFFLQVIPTQKWCGCLTTSLWRRLSACIWSTKRTGYVRSPSSGCNRGILGCTRSEPLTTWVGLCVRRGSPWQTRGVGGDLERKVRLCRAAIVQEQGSSAAEKERLRRIKVSGSRWSQRHFDARFTWC